MSHKSEIIIETEWPQVWPAWPAKIKAFFFSQSGSTLVMLRFQAPSLYHSNSHVNWIQLQVNAKDSITVRFTVGNKNISNVAGRDFGVPDPKHK